MTDDKAACFHASAALHLDSASFAGSRRTYKYYCIDCDVWSSEPIGPWVEVKATPLVSGNSLDDRLSRIETLLTQADDAYWPKLGDDVRELKAMLTEALARKPLFVVERGPAEDPKPAGSVDVSECRACLARTVGADAEIAHKDWCPLLAVTKAAQGGGPIYFRIETLIERVAKLEALVKARLELDSAALDSHERRLLALEAIEAARRGDAK